MYSIFHNQLGLWLAESRKTTFSHFPCDDPDEIMPNAHIEGKNLPATIRVAILLLFLIYFWVSYISILNLQAFQKPFCKERIINGE